MGRLLGSSGGPGWLATCFSPGVWPEAYSETESGGGNGTACPPACLEIHPPKDSDLCFPLSPEDESQQSVVSTVPPSPA